MQTPTIPQISLIADDYILRRLLEAAILQSMISFLLYLYVWNGEDGPFFSQITFINLALNTILALYVRLGKDTFPLGIRLSNHWGTGWEIVAPYSPGINLLIMTIYYGLGNPDYSIKSVISHITFPLTMISCGFTRTFVSWSAGLTIIDVVTSVTTIIMFLIISTIFYYITTERWLYKDGAFPNITKFPDAIFITCFLCFITILSIIHHKICITLSHHVPLYLVI